MTTYFLRRQRRHEPDDRHLPNMITYILRVGEGEKEIGKTTSTSHT
jgi:hypothetical protein